MLAGFRVDLTVQVGRVIKTNIPYVTGNTVTVLSVDFDQLLANPALRSVKGAKINVEPELTIEFTK